MCGIAGQVLGDRRQDARGAVEIMARVLARRGPDSSGLECWPGVALGHRRLAILDLSAAGHQPMVSEDGRVGVVFNGCIYNFRELRAELEQRGCKFKSECDTEVLLHGYREWGVDALAARARGMFAFGVWDEDRETLTLARDRLGVKPVIYCEQGGGIAFASTVKALRAAGFGGEIDPMAVLDIYEFGWVNETRSIFQGIRKLPPAHILEWRDGKAAERRYWKLPEFGSGPRIGFEEAVAETERLILEAVKLRLISDVPVGALLSGGVDSALVCWAMRELNANITAFTARAPHDPSDESADAAATAKALGISHEIVDMPDAGPSLDELVDAYGEPFSCESALAMLWVSRGVKQRATVLLTGDGGDDAFLGYPFFRRALAEQKAARFVPAAAASLWRGVRDAVPNRGVFKRARSLLDFTTGGLGDHIRAHNGLPYFERRGMLGERLAGLKLPERQLEASVESARRLLPDLIAYHHRMHFTCEFMPKVDGGAMYYALEARAPFLDQRMWEFAAGLPLEMHFQGGRLKAVLREIAQRRVGPEVALRRKQGFTVPVEEWLADRWSASLDQLRENTLLEEQGWIRRGSISGPLEESLRKRRVPLQLWRLLVLENWLRKSGTGASACQPCN
jgi:asparagine synthase (glutamine-hydrolysing)